MKELRETKNRRNSHLQSVNLYTAGINLLCPKLTKVKQLVQI